MIISPSSHDVTSTRGSRPRVLWLAPYLPVPTFGGGTRVFNLVRSLSAAYDIDVIAHGRGDQRFGAAPPRLVGIAL